MCCDPGAGRRRRRGSRSPRPPGAGGRPSAARCSPPARSPASTRSTRSAARRRSPRWRSAPRRSQPVDVIAGPGQPLRHRGQAPGRRPGRDRRHRRPERADGGRRRHRGPASWIALDLCAQAEHGDDSPLVVISPDPALLDRVARAGRASSPPSARASPTRRWRWSPRPGLERGARRSPTRSPPSTSSSPSRAPTRRPRAGRVAGCVFVGARRRDRVRRLRGRLQPRAADRRRGALRRAARPGRVHAPHARSSPSRSAAAQNWPPTSPRSPTPRAFRSTASRRWRAVRRLR